MKKQVLQEEQTSLQEAVAVTNIGRILWGKMVINVLVSRRRGANRGFNKQWL